jgi:hypothetical protein
MVRLTAAIQLTSIYSSSNKIRHLGDVKKKKKGRVTASQTRPSLLRVSRPSKRAQILLCALTVVGHLPPPFLPTQEQERV